MPLLLGLQSRVFAFPNRSLGGSLQWYEDSCSLYTSQLAFFLSMHILVLLTYSDMTVAFFSGHIQVAPKHLVFEGSESIVLFTLEK